MSKLVSKNVHSDKLMGPVEAAYFAGFIDGEGTFTIIRSTRKESRSGFRYQPLFSVAGTNRDQLEAVREVCGNGRLASGVTTDRVSPSRKELFVLRFAPNQIRHLVPQLLPYLRLKRPQAIVLMQFLDLIQPGRPLSDPQWAECEQLRMTLRQMNARGGTVIIPDPLRTIRPTRTGNNQWTKPN